MKKYILFIALLFSLQIQAQYKNDNVLYKNVYAEDLVNQLKANPGYVLLDVRSAGEYSDTSSFETLNIGHFKNAKNINIMQLPSRLNEISDLKNTPLFVYCSHSQRSRRASKMLADSGFMKVYNINGGMTTLYTLQGDPTFQALYETSNKYTLISPNELCRSLKTGNIFLLDVRKDSAYKGISTNEKINGLGKIKGSVNIPLETLPTALNQIPKNKKIVVIDSYGDEAVQAANQLAAAGYNNIGVLFDGLENFTRTNKEDLDCALNSWTNNKSYSIISDEELYKLISKDQTAVILDIRPKDDYNNNSKDAWRNVGHVRGSVNYPYADLNTKWAELNAYKNKPVFIMNFGSSPDNYTTAALLIDHRFKKVYVLSTGIFDIRWKAANIKGKSNLKDMVVDIPANNL